METEARRRLVRRLALLCAVLLFAVTSLSAFVRLSNSADAAAAPMAAENAAVTIEREAVLMARGAHRMAASAALLVVVALMVLSLGPRPYLRREGLLSLGMFALVVFLAVLGRWSSGTVGPGVTLGNLLGGFLLFALCWRLAWPEAPAAAAWSWRPALPALLALLALAVQVALGALSHAAHPWVAVIVAALVLELALGAWRTGRRAAAAGLAALLGLQLLIGIGHTAAGSPPVFVLAHNMVALLLFAAIFRMVGKSGKPGSDPHFFKMGV